MYPPSGLKGIIIGPKDANNDANPLAKTLAADKVPPSPKHHPVFLYSEGTTPNSFRKSLLK